ncbi:hypothetical protein H9P43_004237 [Blastocladiella emersonii ATCC 22665]|nr:hypothetical protein H9P43_004237 [Blastocladiella emersonii ATCC 22665]
MDGVRAMAAELAQVKSAITQLSEENAALAKKNAVLAKEVEESRKKIEVLEEANRELTATDARRERELAALQAQVQKLENQWNADREHRRDTYAKSKLLSDSATAVLDRMERDYKQGREWATSAEGFANDHKKVKQENALNAE